MRFHEEAKLLDGKHDNDRLDGIASLDSLARQTKPFAELLYPVAERIQLGLETLQASFDLPAGQYRCDHEADQ